MRLKTIVNWACVGFASSVVMDTYLWVTNGYLIPSWTMAVMSLGVIVLLQVFKREVNLEIEKAIK